MGRTIGLIAMILVVGFAILLILNIWGIFPISFLNLGRLGLTIFILALVAGFCFACYAMFFWKGGGSQRVFPTSSKEKEMMDKHRSDR